ncbi:MAG: hypothetical protein AB7J13_13260 [Pyrinomonadaceae bacterium]
MMISLVSVAIAQSFRTGKLASAQDESSSIQKVKAYADVPLAIEQDDDAPLRILSATVKRLSKTEFEALTENRTELSEVLTVPTASFQNVSERVIRRITIIVDDPVAAHSKGISMKDLSIEPGDFFNVTPQNFVAGQARSSVDENGEYKLKTQDITKSNRFWLPFTDINRLKFRVSVEFQDGEKWFNRSQREGGAK